MRLIGNLIWFVLGGWLMGLSWWFVGCLMFLLIITIPWAKSCFVIGGFCFFPFGKVMISRKELTNRDDIGTGDLGMLGNLIWFFLAGIWLAIGHVVSSIPFFVSIIGIPFGIQHLKLAAISLFPIGKTVVSIEVADAVRRETADMTMNTFREER
ncbi:YccF domain-containing protein [bacterium]|nr:YccF domain-containing protein [bacterium]